MSYDRKLSLRAIVENLIEAKLRNCDTITAEEIKNMTYNSATLLGQWDNELLFFEVVDMVEEIKEDFNLEKQS